MTLPNSTTEKPKKELTPEMRAKLTEQLVSMLRERTALVARRDALLKEIEKE